MKNVFLALQITLSIILIFLILLQGKGSGLGNPLLATSTYSTRRGVEKIIFYLTIIVASLFFISSIAQLIIG